MIHYNLTKRRSALLAVLVCWAFCCGSSLMAAHALNEAPVWLLATMACLGNTVMALAIALVVVLMVGED